MEKVSRRKFVATAAVAGTAALRPPAFAFENQGPWRRYRCRRTG